MNHFLRYWPLYHTFRKVPGCPRTSNGAENGIGRLEDHLKNLKGFRNPQSAQARFALWALQANFRPCVSGEFEGLCPLQRAGVDTTGRGPRHNPISHRNASVAGRGDWLDCTGLAD